MQKAHAISAWLIRHVWVCTALLLPITATRTNSLWSGTAARGVGRCAHEVMPSAAKLRTTVMMALRMTLGATESRAADAGD